MNVPFSLQARRYTELSLNPQTTAAKRALARKLPLQSMQSLMRLRKQILRQSSSRRCLLCYHHARLRIIIAQAYVVLIPSRHLSVFNMTFAIITTDASPSLQQHQHLSEPCSSTLQNNEIQPQMFCCFWSNTLELTPIVCS